MLPTLSEIGSSSLTSTVRLPEMGVAWATGCDIGLKSFPPSAIILRDLSVSLKPVGLLHLTHQSDERLTNQEHRRHLLRSPRCLCPGPPSRAAKDKDSQQLTALPVLIRAPHSWLSAVTRNPTLRAQRTDVNGGACGGDHMTYLRQDGTGGEMAGEEKKGQQTTSN